MSTIKHVIFRLNHADLTVEAAGSYILLHQLEDKLKAHTLYMKFLTEVSFVFMLYSIYSGLHNFFFHVTVF